MEDNRTLEEINKLEEEYINYAEYCYENNLTTPAIIAVQLRLDADIIDKESEKLISEGHNLEGTRITETSEALRIASRWIEDNLKS